MPETASDGLFIDSRKWPDSLHWHYTVFPIGEDEHGRWYVLPGGSMVQRASNPPQEHRCTSVVLIQEGAWWMARWNSDRDSSIELYIDVGTPARIERGTATTIDLDLDVVRSWRGEVQLIDQDEFLQHQEQLGYPEDVIQNAERSAAELLAAIERGDEPFASVGRAWLTRAMDGPDRHTSVG